VALIGIAGAAHVQNAPELWQEIPGIAAVLWSVSGMAISTRASGRCGGKPVSPDRAAWEPDLADPANVAGHTPEIRIS
jgi:hypothetical protein